MRPAVLDKLHDFYRPPPPPWTPQTAGWYVLFALLLLLAAWAVWRIFVNWRRNRYRREALREIARVNVSAIPALLKRTALTAWPREKTASLSGDRWLQFLAARGDDSRFTDTLGQRLLDLDYRSSALEPAEEAGLRELATKWIRRHRVRP
jgi:Domain of unknown function (DUF4381)